MKSLPDQTICILTVVKQPRTMKHLKKKTVHISSTVCKGSNQNAAFVSRVGNLSDASVLSDYRGQTAKAK